MVVVTVIILVKKSQVDDINNFSDSMIFKYFEII